MTDYSRISAKLGNEHWLSSIIHDDGQFASDGGGKTTGSFSAPGKGKSTLMALTAQMCKYVNGSKKDLIHDLSTEQDISSYKIYLETVIWRVRDFDAFANIIPQNWMTSFKGRWKATVKDFHLFVHVDDDLLFYAYDHKKRVIPIRNLPPIERYSDSDDLMRKLHWGAINAVVEPQTYKLSQILIQKLREKKMDVSEDDDREEETDKRMKDRPRGVKKSTRTTQTEYERREVSPAYFWFDLIHVAMRSNKTKHIMFCIDEWDDIAEARSEGDVWKLIDVLASDWKTLRKSNISAQLSTHQTDYVDWRILKRIDYFIWMKGATIHPAYSMITSQNIVSDLPMGLFLIEEPKISFGRQPFDKIPYSQPTVRIDGMKGQPQQLAPSEVKMLLKELVEA